MTNFNLPQTDKEIFETAFQKIVAQGKPSVSPNSGICRYVGEGDIGCAVGVLLPDEVRAYIKDKPVNSGAGVGTLAKAIREKFPVVSNWLVKNDVLLRIIQAHHDDSSRFDDFVTDFTNRMNDLRVDDLELNTSYDS